MPCGDNLKCETCQRPRASPVSPGTRPWMFVSFHMMFANIIVKDFPDSKEAEELEALLDLKREQFKKHLAAEDKKEMKKASLMSRIIKDEIKRILNRFPYSVEVTLKANSIIHHAIGALIDSGFNVMSHDIDSVRIEPVPDLDQRLFAANKLIEANSGMILLRD